jgi:hypothetical protein
MDLVYISGPPGVGKLTVATDLAARTGYKLFHNHLSIGAIEPVFDFGSDAFWSLVHELRERVFETAAREGISLIFTNVYRHPEDFERAYRRFDLVEKHGGRICLVTLTCDQRVLEGRMASPSRAILHKLTNVEELRAQLAKPDILSPIPGRESLVIDNTHLSPKDAASRIIRHYGLQEMDTR